MPPPPSVPQHADWSEQCAQCLDYVRLIRLPADDQMAIIPLISRYTCYVLTCLVIIQCHVTQCRLVIIDFCSCRVKALLHHAEDRSEFFIPWDQVILLCAEHMIAYLNSDLWVSGFHGDNSDTAFTIPSEWLRAQAETSLASVARVTSKITPGFDNRKYE